MKECINFPADLFFAEKIASGVRPFLVAAQKRENDSFVQVLAASF